jgi:protein SCO1/2
MSDTPPAALPKAPSPPSPPRPPGIPVRTAIAGLALALVLLIGGISWLTTRGSSGPEIGGPFTLVDGTGKTVTDRDFRGHTMLVYFGYTFCPDVCPTTLTTVADALDKLGPLADQVRPLFITIDPRRDTQAVVGKYAAAFSPRLIGLTGTAEQIAAVAKEYKVYYAPQRTGPGPDDYTMNHSSILYLIGPDGQFVAPIAADETAQQMADDIRKHLG